MPFAALAGAEVREHYKPKRRLPLHDWHEAAGATFVATGLWLRPLVYSRSRGWDAVLEEARAVRRGVGLTDVSTLGKIDVQGPDAARFLDFIYANTFSTLAVGRARYGIMLREDGMLLDDGTTARLGPRALPHHHHHRQCRGGARAHGISAAGACAAHLDVQPDRRRRSVGAVRGRRSALARGRRRAAARGRICPTTAFPFMAAAQRQPRRASPGACSASPSPANSPTSSRCRRATRSSAWSALLRGRRAASASRPYGLDALNTLRIEKGHVTAAELNGNTSADGPRLRAPAEEAG